MPTDHELLTTHLAERDEPCPGCAYNLRGLTGTRCPECNQELRLRVGLMDPHLAWYIFGIVGIGMSLGFCALLLIWVGSMIATGSSGPQGRDILLLAAGSIVAGALMWWWLGARRRFAGASPRSRWNYAAAAATAAIAIPIWFMATVR